MSKAQEVIDRISKENKLFTIQVHGSDKNQLDAFTILLNSNQCFSGFKKNIYNCITQQTIDLLREAEIHFTILT